MSWQEDLKQILGIPKEARIVTKPYYRTIPKKNGKTYRALTVQYIHEGKRKYKHITKDKERIVKKVLSGEDFAYEYAATKLKELKNFLENFPDEKTRKNLFPLLKEINRLLMKTSTRIF